MIRPRPTALGVKASLFYLLVVGAFLSVNYFSLFFLLVAFLTAMGAAGAFLAFRNLAGVEAALTAPEPVPAGSPAGLVAQFAAPGRPRFAVRVEVALAGGPQAAAGLTVLHGQATAAATVPGLPRGIYPLRRARLASDWPLGVLAAVRDLPAGEPLIVYPAPETGAAPGGGGAGEEIAAAARAGFVQPSALRDYRDGDEPRAVHPRASARRGRPVVREWEGGGGAGTEVVLDRRAAPAALERALSAVAGLFVAARDRKECLTLHTQGVSATFGPGARPWRDLLVLLAGASGLPPEGPPPPPAPPDVLRLPARATAGGAP